VFGEFIDRHANLAFFFEGNLLSSGSALQITSAGFQFLLHSPHAQLWDLLIAYLYLAEVSLRLLTGN